MVLSEEDLLRKAKDWEYCSECRFQSTRQYSINDMEYTHGSISGVQLDGSTLSIEEGHRDDTQSDDY